MESQKYLEKMKSIQNCLLEFLDNEDNVEEKFQNLITLIQNHKIKENRYDLRSIFHLLVKISTNHYRSIHFFDKIWQILQHFKEEIKQTFSNYEIFNIFKGNKRILLYLTEENILTINEPIAVILTNDRYQELNYHRYFFPEIRPFLNEETIQKNLNELPENIDQKRKTDEEDNFIREVIRKDLIYEFLVYIEKNGLQLDSTIETSLFETNSFLINKELTLIECAAFFGSIQIFKHLLMNNVRLPSSLWLYGIHGNKIEILHLLEENHVLTEEYSYDKIFYEAVKCHHNEIANYIQNKFLQNQEEKSTFNISLKYYNFAYIQDKYINKSSFYDVCKHDYYWFVDSILKTEDINVNDRIILM